MLNAVIAVPLALFAVYIAYVMIAQWFASRLIPRARGGDVFRRMRQVAAERRGSQAGSARWLDGAEDVSFGGASRI